MSKEKGWNAGNKPKVLIVHNHYQIPGGEDTVVKNEKKLLESYGYEVVLYSRSNTELRQFHIFQKLFLPFTTVFSLKTYREIKKIIREQQVDILHVHNTLLLISPSVYYAAFQCKIPVVQTVHNFRLLCPGAVFYRKGHVCEECVEHGLLCAVKHSCYRNSKMQTLMCVIGTMIHKFIGTYRKLNYICLTEFNKEKLLMLNRPGKKEIIEEKKVFIKPNFIFSDPNEYQRKQKYGMKLGDRQSRKNQFIYVGRLEKVKGIHILFKAWKLLEKEAPDLVVCGEGEEYEWCCEFIERNNLTSIKMRGFLPNDKVKKLVAESKALIMPTQCYEGFSMTVIEAFSVGTPVIGSDIGNVGEVIRQSRLGWLFQPQDVNELVRRVVNYSDIDSSAFQMFCQEFSEKTNYRILDRIYYEVYRGCELES